MVITNKLTGPKRISSAARFRNPNITVVNTGTPPVGVDFARVGISYIFWISAILEKYKSLIINVK